ncbi:MAG: hypothetical protein K8T90_21780 [Planctomycetes bacterium]|nr:hypothetical protein [Planctomycetota bacterium]
MREDPSDDDQVPAAVAYGHGRMPFFMKLAWVVFLVFVTYYVAVYLIPAAGGELAQ